jgi:hypothetical protein
MARAAASARAVSVGVPASAGAVLLLRSTSTPWNTSWMMKRFSVEPFQ